jgi:hypothetical protein
MCKIEWGNSELFNRHIFLSEKENSYTYKSDYYVNKIIIKIYPEEKCKGKIKISYKFYGYSKYDIIMSL